MPCYHPITAWRSKEVNESGKRSMVFNPRNAEQPDDPLDLPCGQCVGCRLEKSRQWAIRCMHESSMHEQNCFLTLTFDDDALRDRGNVSVTRRDVQLFFKRLRKRTGVKLRYYYCGEYGDKSNRPHYHAIIFGYDFPDKQLHSVSKNGEFRYYKSEECRLDWPYGNNIIGDVTFESAAYVARYVMKKRTGKDAEEHEQYWRFDSETGEAYTVEPEFVGMSRRPGIGKTWFDKWKSDVYPNDFCVLRGKEVRPPKYYDTLLEREDRFQMDDIKLARMEKALEFAEELTPDRLAAREKVKKIKIEKLVRTL